MAKAATRDPERTRARILAAAVKEFAQHGFAGARVDAIAKRARINKRMLYHYFGNKEELFEAIVEQHAREKDAILDSNDLPNPADLMAVHIAACAHEKEWLRLMLWEALEEGEGFPALDAMRAEKLQRAVVRITQAQADGYFPRDLDPRHLLLSLMGMTMFPFAFPQITRAVTGGGPFAPGFIDDRVAYFRRFLKSLADDDRVAAPPPPPVTVDTSAAPPKRAKTASLAPSPSVSPPPFVVRASPRSSEPRHPSAQPSELSACLLFPFVAPLPSPSPC